MQRVAVLFDFDGTITKKDSLWEFIKFYKGRKKFYLGFSLLSPILTLYKLKFIPNWKAKEIVLTWFFKGEEVSYFITKANYFSEKIIPSLIKTKALERIKFHQQKGHEIFILSASVDLWLRIWCDSNQLKLIATRLQVVNNKVTGKLDSLNCYGKEKLERLKAEVNLTEYDYIYAYGDSKGDKEMLAIANEANYRIF